MTEAALIEDRTPADLLARWGALKTESPSLRIRDAAAQMGVAEAELVAARCGDGVDRLTGPWSELIERLPTLGTVMSLTRNDHVVHEKTGRFGNIKIVNKGMGLVLNQEIDLRLLLSHWQSGFSVTEPAAQGVRRSLQFFDENGTAIQKIYQTEETDREAWQALIDLHLAADQAPGIEVSAAVAPAIDRPDDQIDLDRLRELWLALKDVHDFMFMLRKLKAGRLQAMRLVGADLAYRVTPASFRAALEGAAETGLPIMIFVGSPGVIQIHSGPVETLKEVGPWFNVLDPGFNLHLLTGAIASAWVVRKPTADGIVTSLEIFDDQNSQIALMFGVRKEGQPEREDWRALTESLERLPS
tara:strand:- start:46 stop:1116 length:1071 start_codon:yes stop_codon:yes gene_type:complete